VSDTIQVLDLSDKGWEKFDPKDRKAGPVDYPDDLQGEAKWVRTHNEGPFQTINGEIGLAVLQMKGVATDFEGMRTLEETEIMIFSEGSAEATLEDGTTIEINSPALVFVPRGTTLDWRYTSDYVGSYVLLW
jgi:hypothetical protein